jgi:hypothetical protein
MIIIVLITLINTITRKKLDIEKYIQIISLLGSKEIIFSETVAPITVPDEIISLTTFVDSNVETLFEILKTFKRGISIERNKVPIR